MISIRTKTSGVDLSKYFQKKQETLPALILKLMKVTAEEQEENLRTPRSFDGSTLKPLSAKYRLWKSRVLGYTDIFKGKELKLINSIRQRLINDLHGQVYIDKQRDTVMGYLERGGRKGFGLGIRLQDKLKKIGTDWLLKNT